MGQELWAPQRPGRLGSQAEGISPMGRWGHAGLRMEAACEVQGGVQSTVHWGNVCKPAQLGAEQEEGRGSGRQRQVGSTSQKDFELDTKDYKAAAQF